ncbi:MAG TPA: ABC transporter ATP-binding protein [Candidatus Hydrogenedentes bacterium]|nr:ABC transporter ATP-binding protein [Candidatus Hydrogenedentota bacterium]
MTSDAIPAPSPHLQMQKYSGLGGLLHILRYFVPYLIPFWDKILLRFLLVNCVTLLSAWVAVAAGNVIDKGLTARDAAGFHFWLLAGLGLGLGALVLSFTLGVISTYITTMLEGRFRLDMFKGLHRQSLRFFHSRPIGEHMYRTNDDPTVTTLFLGTFLLQIIEKFQILIVSIGVALSLNPQVAYLIVGYLLLYTPFCHFSATYVRWLNMRGRWSIQNTFSSLQECLAGYPVSKAFAREKWSLCAYYRTMADATRIFIQYLVGNSIFMHLTNPAPPIGLMRLLFLFLGGTAFFGYHVIVGDLTPGQYVFMGGLILQMMGPIEEMVNGIANLRIWSVPAERMLQTLEVEPEIQDVPNAIELPHSVCRIEFQDVSFRYAPDLPDVVKGVSFSVEPGTKVALVGMSGAGKTSIFNVLMRFYDPTGGRVLIGGHDLRQIRLDSYRSQIGLVLQESHLFSATLRDNILIGNPHASQEDLAAAIDRAGMTPLVASLPDGLDSIISEAGNLSAGDRQRIAIARALLRSPQFFFLDEPTSALDPETTREIVRQLNKVVKGKTCLVIAHSLQMIVDADEIIVMDHGVVTQRGKHAELVAQKGLYRDMWEADLAKYGSFYGEGEGGA